MRKYLNMENATLEINFNDISAYDKFLQNNFDDIINQNFNRIIFHIKEESILRMQKIINVYFKDRKPLVIFYTNLNNSDYSKFDNIGIMIVNQNSNNIIVKDNIHNLIELNSKNINLITSEINQEHNIILEPVIDIKNISEFINTMNLLFSKLDSKNINLNGFLMSSFLMREHPCNAYLCNGWKCGKKISCLPKHIYIDNLGNIYPHNLFFDKFLIGNISKNTLAKSLENYYDSKNYITFIEYNKKVFIKYLTNYPYNFFPLIEFIREEVENDK